MINYEMVCLQNKNKVDNYFYVFPKTLLGLAKLRKIYDSKVMSIDIWGLLTLQVNTALNSISLGFLDPWFCDQEGNQGHLSLVPALFRNLAKGLRSFSSPSAFAYKEPTVHASGIVEVNNNTGWTTYTIPNKTQTYTVFSELGNMRHLDVPLGAQVKLKLWSWESPDP